MELSRGVDGASVVIVGGGIGGSALATVLARAGVDVMVLEREEKFRDRVRGEAIAPWGVVEAQRLGLVEALVGAGAGYASVVVPYDELLSREEAEAARIPVGLMIPGVAGWLDVGHPAACEALLLAAAVAGAVVKRGVHDIAIGPGPSPCVTYFSGGREHRTACRLIVGADGRGSTTRRQIGIRPTTKAARTLGGGMLVTGVDSWPSDQWAVGTSADLYYIVVPRPGGVIRLYLLTSNQQKGRFAGPSQQRDFLDAFRFPWLPGSCAIADGIPAGPCVFSPMTDGWCDEPLTDGVVLLGDAAGWNDPIIGQGLSIALRDARMVSDILLGDGDWSPKSFGGYAEERSERMRRLRITAALTTDIRATFTPEAARRRRLYHDRCQTDASLLVPFLPVVVGPDNVPADTFDPTNIERILSLA